MNEENISQEFILKEIDKTRNYVIENPFGLNVEESVCRSLFLVILLRCTWSSNVGR